MAVAVALAFTGFGVGVAATASASGNATYYACLYKGLLSKVSTKAHSCSIGKAVNWSQTGPQGVPGPPGPAGPQYIASALVAADGSISLETLTTGATLTVTHLTTGVYRLVITGLGTHGVLPVLQAYGGTFTLGYGGGTSGGGALNTVVATSNGLDESWSFYAIGGGAGLARPVALPRPAAFPKVAMMHRG